MLACLATGGTRRDEGVEGAGVQKILRMVIIIIINLCVLSEECGVVRLLMLSYLLEYLKDFYSSGIISCIMYIYI